MAELLTDEELADIQQFADDVIDSTNLGGSVLYQSYLGRGTYSPTSGQIQRNFAGTWINAYVRPITDYEIKMSDGHYLNGDYYYQVSPRDIIIPKKDDRIVDNGTTRYVYEFTTDSIRTFHILVVRNI